MSVGLKDVLMFFFFQRSAGGMQKRVSDRLQNRQNGQKSADPVRHPKF
jgi:hypothetical protein